MMQFLKANNLSNKYGGEHGTFIGINKARVRVDDAEELLASENYNSIIDLFNNKGYLKVIVFNPIPPYVDIPTPEGRFLIAYSLLFLNAKNSMFRDNHPNYRSKQNIKWGPPSLTIQSDVIVNIKFTPTNNMSSYNHSDPDDWENTDTFWNWFEYLQWLGEIN